MVEISKVFSLKNEEKKNSLWKIPFDNWTILVIIIIKSKWKVDTIFLQTKKKEENEINLFYLAENNNELSGTSRINETRMK